MSAINALRDAIFGEGQDARVVPPTGYSARLTLFTAGAMAFLAVFALALSLGAGRVADRWSDALARTATIRISAPPEELEAQTAAVLRLLEQTPGVAAARALSDADQRALLEPWFGPDLPIDDLPVPRLIEVTATETGYDVEGLRQRLSAEAPGAVLDDHRRWRQPLVSAAARLRILGWAALALIVGATAAMVTLAAGSALAANDQVIRVLRLIGAKDRYITRAFVRRFTLRAFIGATLGAGLGLLAVLSLPQSDTDDSFLTGFGFRGLEWALPMIIPVLAAVVAFLATHTAAHRMLQGMR